ncbi:MAG: type IV pilus modification PilV family protein [Planctomycetota bacterium]|jgi:Tfp pilus assembly protein PilE
MIRAKRNKRGFTLVEAITASVILSGAVLAVVTISTQSLGDIRLNRHYEVAVALADKQLTMIDYIGVDNFIDSGQTEGDFEEYEPGYHWKVVSESLAIDNLYQVKITVSWVESKR